MIKAVFFDLYHTLIHYDPPREEALSAALGRQGISIAPKALRLPIVAGDEFFYQSNARKGMSQRSEEEKQELWASYEAVVLKEAGVEPRAELIRAILADMRQTKFNLVLFDDVVPVFTELAGRGLALGLVSNANKDASLLLDRLGITPWLRVSMTSEEAGASKPQPEIFHQAVRRAGMSNSEVLYIGDQYRVDVLGARGAGLQALLLDRGGYFEEVPAGEKIESLYQVAKHLDGHRTR